MIRYYTRLRPVGIGTIPKVRWEFVEVPLEIAHRRPDLPVSRRPYGVFTTDRPLTAQELCDFEISIDGDA